MENFRRQVLRLFAVFHAPRNIRVHAFEVVFVEFGETAGVALRRLDHQPLVSFVVQSPQAFSPRGTAFTYLNRTRAIKVTRLFAFLSFRKGGGNRGLWEAIRGSNSCVFAGQPLRYRGSGTRFRKGTPPSGVRFRARKPFSFCPADKTSPRLRPLPRVWSRQTHKSHAR